MVAAMEAIALLKEILPSNYCFANTVRNTVHQVSDV
jgi:hypothetical protein